MDDFHWTIAFGSRDDWDDVLWMRWKMRLIDAEQLSKHKYVGLAYDRIIDTEVPASAVHILAYKWGWNDALDSVAEFAPTIDAIEVVRCKDCKYNYHNMIPSGEAEYGCTKCIELPIAADFYCSLGERREDEAN